MSEAGATLVDRVSWAHELLEASGEGASAAWAKSISVFARRLAPRDRAIFLAKLCDQVSAIEEEAAIAVEGGLHPGYRIVRFDEFAAARIPRGSRVLDLGCGEGTVSVSVAERVGGILVGVDQDGRALRKARALSQARGVSPPPRFIEDDFTTCRVEGPFDALILSGVLEGLDGRAGHLRHWREWYAPAQVFVRVAVFDSNWRAAFRQELGISSGPGSAPGMTLGMLERELGEAGLRLKECVTRWGEYWGVAEEDGSAFDGAIRVPRGSTR